MKSFLVNGQKIKPTITDDWKYYFQEDGGMVLTSEKLDLKIPLRAAKIEKFFDQVHKSTITIVGNSIVGDYLINKDFSNHLVSNPTIKAPGVDPNSISDKMYLMNLDVNFVNNWNAC